MLGHGPVGEVDLAGAGVEKLDEAIRRIGRSAGAELVDLYRVDVSHFLGGCFGALAAFVEFVHEALPTRSPLKAAGPEVTLKVALAFAPGAMVSVKVFEL